LHEKWRLYLCFIIFSLVIRARTVWIFSFLCIAPYPAAGKWRDGYPSFGKYLLFLYFHLLFCRIFYPSNYFAFFSFFIDFFWRLGLILFSFWVLDLLDCSQSAPGICSILLISYNQRFILSYLLLIILFLAKVFLCMRANLWGTPGAHLICYILPIAPVFWNSWIRIKLPTRKMACS
jgi:hypothetical protein